MPVGAAIVAGSVVAGGSALIAGGKAAGASERATETTTALNREMFDKQQQNNAPYLAAGSNALMALQGRGQGAPAPGGAPPAAANQNSLMSIGQPQGPNWSAYLSTYPDVANAYAGLDPATRAAIGVSSPEQFAAWHYQHNGQSEGRALPTYEQAPATEPAPVAQSQPAAPLTPIQTASAIDPNTNDFSALMGQTLAARPTAEVRPGVAPRPEAVRPTVAPRPDQVRPTEAPLDVSTASYVQSPDYNFQLAEGNKNLITNLSAVGGRESGAALKAVQKYGQSTALGDYAQWRSYATGQYNANRDVANHNFEFDANRGDNNYAYDTSRTDQNYQYDTGRSDANYTSDANRRDNNFNVDRGYATDVYNTDRGYATDTYINRTNDLFKLSSLGQGAVGQAAASGQTYAGNNSNAVFSNAATQGNAALSAAGTISGAVNNGVSAYTSYLGRQDQNALLKAFSTPKAA